MIRPGIVQDKVMDFSSRKKLPPLASHPQWPRGTLDKSRYPKPMVKDKNNTDLNDEGGARQGEMTEAQMTFDLSGMNPVQHIMHLERSIAFIRQQHAEVLNALHSEIMKLKQDNKDLHLRIIMTQKSSASESSIQDTTNSLEGSSKDPKVFQPSTSLLDVKKYPEQAMPLGTSRSTESSLLDERHQADKMKIVFLQDEVKQLKTAVREGSNRNFYMSQAVDKLEDQKRHLQSLVDKLQYQQQQKAVQNGFTMEKIPPEMKPDGITDASNRAPTLSECEVIIKHLRRINEKQSHELDALKSDLRDVLYSHKWTPDAYLLAKAYVAADDTKGTQLPNINQRKM